MEFHDYSTFLIFCNNFNVSKTFLVTLLVKNLRSFISLLISSFALVLLLRLLDESWKSISPVHFLAWFFKHDKFYVSKTFSACSRSSGLSLNIRPHLRERGKKMLLLLSCLHNMPLLWLVWQETLDFQIFLWVQQYAKWLFFLE